MTTPAQRPRSAPAHTIDPGPGLWLTLVLSYPYLSDRLTSFPRTSGHDVVFGLIIGFIWGSVFLWDAMGKWLPFVQSLIKLVCVLLVVGGTASLYGIALYFMFTQ